MVPLAAGVVVLVRFPFSDLSQTKLRPAVVLANAGRGDWILCQVTSYAPPGKLFTASVGVVVSVAGVLQPKALRKAITLNICSR